MQPPSAATIQETRLQGSFSSTVSPETADGGDEPGEADVQAPQEGETVNKEMVQLWSEKRLSQPQEQAGPGLRTRGSFPDSPE